MADKPAAKPDTAVSAVTSPIAAPPQMTKHNSDSRFTLPKFGKRPTNVELLKTGSKGSVNDIGWRFGSPIKDTLTGGRTVPLVVESSIRALKVLGVQETGLFRVSGSSSNVNELKLAFEAGQDPLAAADHPYPPESIASCLKQFLRQTAGSIICQDKYALFTAISSVQPEAARLAKVREALRTELPPENFDLLAVLCEFLNLVSAHADVNMMGTSNLAVVFGPTLMVSPNDDAMLLNSSRINALVELMIQHFQWLFYSATADPNPLEKPAAEKLVAAPAGAGQPVPEPKPRKPARRAPTARDAAGSTENLLAAVGDAAEAATSGAPAEITPTAKPIAEQLTAPAPVAEQMPRQAEKVEPAAPRAQPRKIIDRVRAKFDFQARQDTELSFAMGDVMVILEKPSSSWWYGALNNKQGYIAVEYVVSIPPTESARKVLPAQSKEAVATGVPVAPALAEAASGPAKAPVAAAESVYMNLQVIQASIAASKEAAPARADMSKPAPEATTTAAAELTTDAVVPAQPPRAKEGEYINVDELTRSAPSQASEPQVRAGEADQDAATAAPVPHETALQEEFLREASEEAPFSFTAIGAQAPKLADDGTKSPVFEFVVDRDASPSPEHAPLPAAPLEVKRAPSPAPKPKARHPQPAQSQSPLKQVEASAPAAPAKHVEDEDDPNWRPPPPSTTRRRSFGNLPAPVEAEKTVRKVDAASDAAGVPAAAPRPQAPPKPSKAAAKAARMSEFELPPPPDEPIALSTFPSIDLGALPPPPDFPAVLDDSEA